VNRSIKTLTLNSCGIADEGCKALAEVLKRNTTITELELNNNMVDYEGCAALAEALANNNALKVSLSLTVLVDWIPVTFFGKSPALTHGPSCNIDLFSLASRRFGTTKREESSADRRGFVLSQMCQLMGLKALVIFLRMSPSGNKVSLRQEYSSFQ
jgi:hypothetical protein